MKFFDTIEKLSVLDKLLRQGHTGTPSELAKRLSISRSTLYDIIDELHSRGVEIKYSRSRYTFYYHNHVALNLYYSIKPVAEMESDNFPK